MRVSSWKDYEIIATGDGMKLERWGDVKLLRPDPQIIWPARMPLEEKGKPHAVYDRSSGGGGAWRILKPFPKEWAIKQDNLTFLIKPMGFKHTGLFPEQLENWRLMQSIVTNAFKAGKTEVKVLNLFGYTGGASVALAAAGAVVTHVDAAKNMVERCKQNAQISSLGNAKIRYIIDDCEKFVGREIKRENFYDAIIMDPPSFGRGPNGETWKIEENLFNLIKLCKQVLKPAPLFFLVNSYTTGLSPTAIENMLRIVLEGESGKFESYELGLPTGEGITLPAGASSIFVGEKNGNR